MRAREELWDRGCAAGPGGVADRWAAGAGWAFAEGGALPADGADPLLSGSPCRAANEQLMHSRQYAFRDRRARKGEFRRLWIVRINAACRQHDISYSRFVAGLKTAGIDVDRKILADLAVHDSAAFGALVAVAREALQAA